MAAWHVVAAASQAVVACLAAVASQAAAALPAEVPAVVVASWAEAREVDRAEEDSPRARRSVALDPVRNQALEEEEAESVEWADVLQLSPARPALARADPPLPAAQSDSEIARLSVSPVSVTGRGSAVSRAWAISLVSGIDQEWVVNPAWAISPVSGIDRAWGMCPGLAIARVRPGSGLFPATLA